MPGVVFLIVVPTANFERELIYGTNHEIPPPVLSHATSGNSGSAIGIGGPSVDGGNNNLNINLAENSNNNAILRLEVELRDKNAPKYKRGVGLGRGGRGGGGGGRAGSPHVRNALPLIGPAVSIKHAPRTAAGRAGGGPSGGGTTTTAFKLDDGTALIPLEKVLEELLAKLVIEHVTWTTGKKGYFHQVMFPLQSGEPCETTLHCLTELGIGTKLNSSVSVLPCSVSYDALTAAAVNDDFYSDEFGHDEDLSKWNNFVESIKSKLTVKQVVDGVRSGGALSFDYLLLIVTADSLAALGLVENNASNIVAAMLVSPLMGPVMSITFGTVISDRELIRVGFISLGLGMFISCLFGFIFGLILGTTEMPWGSGDWPTEEMRGRGNVRSLWMGVLWALTSGTGVAVALLQGSAGPLIGVAISASLLPPVVNCGLFWALACIWQIYPDIRMPYLKGEPVNGNSSSYPFIYTDYLPTEFLINGIVSSLLTVVNVICIFITAIIILKIKEVSAPYTASPDLKRFWETDLRTARKTNRSTMRHNRRGGGVGGAAGEKLLPGYQGLQEPHNHELDTVLEQALKEAEDDVTFKKVKRMSYSSNAAGEITQRLAKIAGLNTRSKQEGNSSTGIGIGAPMSGNTLGSRAGSRINSIRNSKVNADLKALDKLVASLLEQQHALNSADNAQPRKSSVKLNRWRPTSRSAHSFNFPPASGVGVHTTVGREMGMMGASALGAALQEHLSGAGQHSSSSSAAVSGMMPTIMESTLGGTTSSGTASTTNWTASLERRSGAVRNVLNSMATTVNRLSGGTNTNGTGGNGGNSHGGIDEENLNLTENYIG